jgi:hypothetical protein
MKYKKRREKLKKRILAFERSVSSCSPDKRKELRCPGSISKRGF